MDLRKLKAFVVVADELNFRRSAELLGMSQPPLTRLIASLEDELSTKLFERTTRKVELTGAGMFLLKEAREIVSRADILEKELRAMGPRRSGKLSVGFSTTAFLACLPKIIEEFRDRFPKVKLHLHQESRRGVIEGLKSGKFAVGFLEGETECDGLERHLVQDEALGVLLPKNHRLAKKKEIELRELKDDVFILHPRREQQAPFDAIHRLCAENGFKPRTYIKNQRESCPVLVAIGTGVSLTVSSSQGLVPRETRFVPVRRLYLPVSVLWTSDSANQSLRSFLSFVIENASLRRPNTECLVDAMRL